MATATVIIIAFIGGIGSGIGKSIVEEIWKWWRNRPGSSVN